MGVIVRVGMSVVVGVLVAGSEKVTVGVSVGVPVEVAVIKGFGNHDQGWRERIG